MTYPGGKTRVESNKCKLKKKKTFCYMILVTFYTDQLVGWFVVWLVVIQQLTLVLFSLLYFM